METKDGQQEEDQLPDHRELTDQVVAEVGDVNFTGDDFIGAG